MQLSLFAPVRKSSRLSQKDRVLAMLEANEWVTNVDFLDTFPRLPNFRSRISELRREGYQIVEGQYVKEGVWKYHLVKDGE